MRKGITPTLRFQVLNRDGFSCQYCWLKASEWVQLQVDHKISVKNWWLNNLDNLITACFQCNIWKWKNNLEEVKTNIYERKISDCIWKHLMQFYKWWNFKQLWNIDNNTKALLNIYVWNQIWWDNYLTRLDFPPIVEQYIWKSYKEITMEDLDKLDNLFKKGWEYCDNVLSIIECNLWTIINEEIDQLDIENCVLSNLLNDKIWRAKCKDDYNNRLNYILTETLINLYNDWLLKNNYSIKKFSYFFNEIQNG